MIDPRLRSRDCIDCIPPADQAARNSYNFEFLPVFGLRTPIARIAPAPLQKAAMQCSKIVACSTMYDCMDCMPLKGGCRRRAKLRTASGRPASGEARDAHPAISTRWTVAHSMSRGACGRRRVLRNHKLNARETERCHGPELQLRTGARAHDDTTPPRQMPANESVESLDERNEAVRTHPSRKQRSRSTDSPEAVARMPRNNRGRTDQ